jgi:hypothetical protein
LHIYCIQKKNISIKQYLCKILSSFSVNEIANHKFTTETCTIVIHMKYSVLHVNAELSLLLSFGTWQIKCQMHAL